MSKKFVSFLAAALVATSVPVFASTAQAATADGFNYSLDGEGNATVTGCASSCPTNLVIPATLGGNPVTFIGESAFIGKLLTSVTIPDSVVDIGADAFRACFLNSVTIGASVVSIGTTAFFYNELTSVTIPNSVTNIGGSAFDMNKLTSVTLGTSLTTLGDYAFNGSKLTEVTIPNSVTTIGEGVFSSNLLTSVTIPNSVTNIGGSAFSGNKLAAITIPNSVTSIGYEAFKGNLLASITLSNAITTLGVNAFTDNLLTSVEFKGGSAPNSGSDIFSGNSNLSSIRVPSDATGWGATFAGLNVDRSGEPIVPIVAPSYTTAAKVSGKAKVGSTLAAKAGTWSGTANISYKYQWYSCSKAVKSAVKTGKIPSTCKSISKATKSTLKLTSKEKARYVSVLITATNKAGKAAVLAATIGTIK